MYYHDFSNKACSSNSFRQKSRYNQVDLSIRTFLVQLWMQGKDLLSSRKVENIIENSDFIVMLNQAADDRQILANTPINFPHQLSYVTHSGEGEGLLFYGNVILPFVDTRS